MPQASEAKRVKYIKPGRNGHWEGMKLATILLVVFMLSECGTVATSQRPDYGPRAFELRFKEQVDSTFRRAHRMNPIVWLMPDELTRKWEPKRVEGMTHFDYLVRSIFDPNYR